MKEIEIGYQDLNDDHNHEFRTPLTYHLTELTL